MRFAHVVERRVELTRPTRFVGSAQTGAGLLGEVDVYRGMRVADRGRLRSRRETLASELAQRLQLAVATTGTGPFGSDHRLVDKGCEQAGDVDLVDAVSCAHWAGLIERMRAAASSSVRGTPSSRMQISAIAAALSVPSSSHRQVVPSEPA